MRMNEFVIKLTALIPVFTCEMEKWSSKLPIVIQQISETAETKPGLPFDRARAFEAQLGQPCLLAAQCDALPWLPRASNSMAGKSPSLPQNRFVGLCRNLRQRLTAWSGESLFCLTHKARSFHAIPACSNIGSLCEVCGLSRKMVCAAY